MLLTTNAESSVKSEKENDTPRFQQGETERETYEKTLSANEKLTVMIRGNDPDFSYKTWGAIHRDSDVYWVRLIFQNAAGDEIEYIW